MATKFVGKALNHKGKRLYEILFKLKDFGVGRMVYRHMFKERYEEPCYYVITKVQPDFASGSPITSVKSKAWAYQVWRGEDKGEMCITRCYKWDWRLVPKSEEEAFMKYDKPIQHANVIPEKLNFAPLHEFLIMQEKKRKGIESPEKPYMQRVIRKLPYNRAMLQSELDLLENEDLFTGQTLENNEKQT